MTSREYIKGSRLCEGSHLTECLLKCIRVPHFHCHNIAHYIPFAIPYNQDKSQGCTSIARSILCINPKKSAFVWFQEQNWNSGPWLMTFTCNTNEARYSNQLFKKRNNRFVDEWKNNIVKLLWDLMIRGSTHKWINSWLSGRTQQVILDGQDSDSVLVLSCVP